MTASLSTLGQGCALQFAVCGLEELGRRSPDTTHVLSILDPDVPDPETLADHDAAQRLVLRFHDVIAPGAGKVLPSEEHVAALLAFGDDLDVGGGAFHHLLVHCHMGISRSTAAAAILLAQHCGSSIEGVFDGVAAVRPQAWPNSLMVSLADRLLGYEGRLVHGLRRLYARQLATRPDLGRFMRDLGRSAEVETALTN